MSAETSIPLLFHEPGEALAFWRGRNVSREQFLSDAVGLSADLPQSTHAINLCDDRYSFLVAFAAAMLADQTTLLPPSRASGAISDIADRHPGCYCLVDRVSESLPLAQYAVSFPVADADAREIEVPEIPSELLAAVAFTSGSTGSPRANAKRWGDLVTGARLADRRFAVSARRPGTILATVPPQHMYGLEVSIMLPLVAGIRVHGGLPFYPEDIRRALLSVPGPRILFTTPTHLRACVEAGLEWPEVSLVVSATAPLSAALARRAEKRLATRVLEIYGCTEAGSMASRRTVEGDVWRLYDGLAAEERDGVVLVSGGHVPHPVELSDYLEIRDDQTFRLLGRHSDLVNIAGNRASLSDLNLKLNAIDGVRDGVFVTRGEAGDDTVTRLAALVVAPDLSTKEILARLAHEMNPVFLPRPLFKVARLPRNALGKLPREDLLAMLEELERSR